MQILCEETNLRIMRSFQLELWFRMFMYANLYTFAKPAEIEDDL